jgi:glycosyltransferase involved in cell wall biosynthesis
MKHYNEIDVLMVPLQSTKFNENKSELKFVEAGMMNVAVIASDFGPYTIGSKNFFERGGGINENGNCVLIDPDKKHKDWKKAIVKLVNNPEYIEILKKNLHNTVKDKYNIENVTKTRAEWYKSIVKK